MKRCFAVACFILLAGVAVAQKPQAKADPKLARGRYIVENVSLCYACHSELNPKTIMPMAGRKGSGAKFADMDLPFPLYVPNLSPDPETGIGKFTDEQLGRAIREGIGHDGRVLFPIMPYMSYRNMSDEDLAAVIAYVRSIAAVRKAAGESVPPPVRSSLRPPPLQKPVAMPEFKSPANRGEYLVHLADCTGCHTPVDFQKMQPMMELAFAGGMTLNGPAGKVASANITQHASGISYYDEAMFVKAMRTGHVGARRLSLIMPTGYYKNITDTDLKAIFAYLKTLKPVKHRVDNTLPPTYCKVCRGTHGAGDKNQ